MKAPTVISVHDMIFDWFMVGAGHAFSTLKKEAYIHFLKNDLQRSNVPVTIAKSPTAIMEERKYILSVKTLLEGVPVDKNGFFNLNGDKKIHKDFLTIENANYEQHSVFLSSYLYFCINYTFIFFTSSDI